jgi:mannose-6-phosphate isomerase-like protein (cupin superfamily)
MTIDTSPAGPLRLLAAGAGEITGGADRNDRYRVDGAVTGGRVALVEQTIAPHTLAAPLHRHSREDEYSFVLAGTLGVVQDGVEIVARPGDLVFKPRGRWHTFWSAGADELRILEVISPAGIEELFRLLAQPGGEYDPQTMPALGARFGCEVDFEGTVPLVERHGLRF